MKLNYFAKRVSTMGRWLTVAMLCMSAITFIWQGAFFFNSAAIAVPIALNNQLIASADVGDRVQGKASEDAGRAKNFIRDTADRVERTANKNARRVERATDSDGSYVERKAKRDRDRIERRAEEDAARTEKAVDNTKNVVERTVDNIKDAFRD